MRLLIIEDEYSLANTLSRGFRRLGYAVDIALCGKEGWEMAMVNEYDLLILDLNLPEMDGMEVCHRLRSAKHNVLILMLTARDRLEDRITGLDIGADDYVIKPFHFKELAARVRALLRRDLRARDPLLECNDLKLDPATCTVWQNKRRLELTRKEFGVLEYLMRHTGEVISQEVLLEHVWDTNADPLTNTVRTHIGSLRRKLNDDADSPRYIETVVGQGYRLIAPPTQEEDV